MKLLRHNLTLLELVICLGIVAALSSLLLDNFATVKLQECVAQTCDRGLAVRRAVLGDAAAGTPGFLSDLGRWPQVQVDTDAQGFRQHGRNLAQLYDRTVFYHHDAEHSMLNHPDRLKIDGELLGLPVDPVFTHYNFPEAVLNVGWRGPYLPLTAPEGAYYRDGWGESWKILHRIYFNKPASSNKLIEKATVLTETETTPSAATEIEGIKSFGADHREDSASHPADFAASDQVYTFSMEQYWATLHVTLRVRNEANPARWVALQRQNATPTAAKLWLDGSGQTAAKNEVVYATDGTQKYFYISQISDNAQAPHLPGNFRAPGPGWECRVKRNWVTPDAVKVLLFAPAKTANTAASGHNGTMKTGFFRFAPCSPDELNNPATVPDLVMVPLQYRSGGNFFHDADATPSAHIDWEVKWGEEPNLNRSRARHNWISQPSGLSSTFTITTLVPGRRKILAFAGFLSGNFYFNQQISELEDIVLQPGDNYLTLYLESRD